MNLEQITKCWACKSHINDRDNYCRICGKGQGMYVPYYYKQWGIIILTLLALGPFSLFFVWRSPVLSDNAKWINTIFITIFTFYVFYTFYKIWVSISGILSTMGV